MTTPAGLCREKTRIALDTRDLGNTFVSRLQPAAVLLAAPPGAMAPGAPWTVTPPRSEPATSAAEAGGRLSRGLFATPDPFRRKSRAGGLIEPSNSLHFTACKLRRASCGALKQLSPFVKQGSKSDG